MYGVPRCPLLAFPFWLSPFGFSFSFWFSRGVPFWFSCGSPLKDAYWYGDFSATKFVKADVIHQMVNVGELVESRVRLLDRVIYHEDPLDDVVGFDF